MLAAGGSDKTLHAYESVQSCIDLGFYRSHFEVIRASAILVRLLRWS
jgi:hypothetical protein